MKIIAIIITVSGLSWAAFAAPQMQSVAGSNILNDSKTTVSAENKKGMAVVFLSAKCPCSNSHMTELAALAKDFPEFSFVGIHSNADEELAMSKAYFGKAELPFVVIQDQNMELADRFRALKTPHAFLLSPEGKILYQGGVSSSKDFEKADQKYLRQALDDIQNQRSVKTSEGRTLGCVISRGEKNVW